MGLLVLRERRKTHTRINTHPHIYTHVHRPQGHSHTHKHTHIQKAQRWEEIVGDKWMKYHNPWRGHIHVCSIHTDCVCIQNKSLHWRRIKAQTLTHSLHILNTTNVSLLTEAGYANLQMANHQPCSQQPVLYPIMINDER